MTLSRFLAAAASVTLLLVTPFAFGSPTAVIRPNVRRMCSAHSLGIDDARAYAAWSLDSLRFDGDLPVIERAGETMSLPPNVAARTYTDADGDITVVLGDQVSLPTLAHELAHVRWRNMDSPHAARARLNATLRAPGQDSHVFEALTSVRSNLASSGHSSEVLPSPLDSLQIHWPTLAMNQQTKATEVLRNELLSAVMHDSSLFHVVSARRQLHIAAMESLSGKAYSQKKSSPTYWSTKDEIGYELAEEVAGYATADTVRAGCMAYAAR